MRSPFPGLFRVRTMALAFALIVAGLLLSGAVYEALANRDAVKNHPAPGAFVDIGDHRLHLLAMGDAGPSIVLEAGAGGTVLDWSAVHPALAAFGRVYAYDRAGLGWSDEGPLPRTCDVMVDELHELLEKAEAPAPYILVGHSFGGLVVRRYASRYPDDVAGLVLVDAVHEDFYEAMPSAVAKARDGQLKMLSMAVIAGKVGLPRLLFPPLAPQGLQGEAAEAAKARGYQAKTYRTVRAESRAFDESAAQVRNGEALSPEIPVTVLTRTRDEAWPSDVPVDEAEGVWKDLQSRLAALTPKTTQVFVEDSGHYIHIEQPHAVVDAVRAIMDAAR